MYEIHITLPMPEKESRKMWLENWAANTDWRTSFIDGDPLLGEKRFFYYTRHKLTRHDAFQAMLAQKKALEDAGFKVLRCKIEEIIFDERYE